MESRKIRVVGAPESESSEVTRALGVALLTEATNEFRTATIVRLIDKLDEHELNEADRVRISRFATDKNVVRGVNADLDDLSDLTVEELSEVEYASVITRANYALRIVLETRTRFVSDVYYYNRGDSRRAWKQFEGSPEYRELQKARAAARPLQETIPTGEVVRKPKGFRSNAASKLVASQKQKREFRNEFSRAKFRAV